MNFILADRMIEGHGRAKELVGLVQAVETVRHWLSIPASAGLTEVQVGQRQALQQLAANIIQAQIHDAVQRMLATYISEPHHLAQLQSQGINSLIRDRIAIIQQSRPDDEAFTFGELKSWFKN